MDAWFQKNKGIQRPYRPSSAELRQVLERLGTPHAPAHLALGAALYDEGDIDAAEKYVVRALELEHPLPGLALNYLACIAWRRGDEPTMRDHLTKAYKLDPQHAVVVRNIRAIRAWMQRRDKAMGPPLALEASSEFELIERPEQPMLPGPLPDGFERWDDELGDERG